MGFFYFLRRKKFYIHVGIAIVLTFFLLWLSFQVLKLYTRHGDTISIQDFNGMTLEEIKAEGLDKHFNFVVEDSVYDPTKDKGIIIQQNPLPFSKVKKGRKVYLTIVAKNPEKISMPDLTDLSLRQALVILESSGLRVDSLEYITHFAENAILGQMFKNKEIEPGTLIEKGSKIKLVIGSGYSQKKLPIPFLIGKKQKAAIKLIHRASFNIGNEYFLDGRDTATARIYQQEPSWDSDTILQHGNYIDVWYRSEELFDFDEYILSLFPDTTRVDTILTDSIRNEIIDKINNQE